MTDDLSAKSERVFEGAQLSTALKSEPGQVILEKVMANLADTLTRLLMNSADDAEILTLVHRARGIIDAFGDIGDSVRFAAGIVARHSLKDQLKTSRPKREE